MWDEVKKLTGKEKSNEHHFKNFTCTQLNEHYAAVSFDEGSRVLYKKSTCSQHVDFVTKFSVFRALDTLKKTSAGLDGIPHWFLQIAAPWISKPIAHLFNLSIEHSYVHTTWKNSIITPVKKLANLQN